MNRLLTLILIFLLLFSFSSFAYADDINDDPLDEVFGVLRRFFADIDDLQSEITMYESSNYYLDIKNYSALFDPIKKLTSNINGINNLLFGVNKMISKLTIIMLLFSYKVDLFSMFGEHIDLILDALKVPIYDKAILTVIAFIGLYSVVSAVFADRKATVLNSTIRTLVIVTVALIFMSNPSGYLSKMNDLSIEVSDELFKSTYGRYKRVPDSEDALVSAGSMLWDVMVHKPWQTLVIGTTTDNRLTDEILSENPFSDERLDLIDDLSEDTSLVRLEGIFPRFGALLLFTVFNIALAVIVILVSAASIFAQTMVVAFSFIAPIIFLISLIPRYSDTLGAWALKLCGYSFIKIAISLFLALLLVINAAIFTEISSNGLIVTLILMASVTFAVYHSREKIAGLIKAVPKGERAVRREMKTPSGAAEKVKDYKNIVTGYGRDKITTGADAVKTKALEVGKTVVNRKDTSEHENYKSMAKEYLTRQYSEQKKAAELKAERLGIDNVKYNDFVSNADTRSKLGEEMFAESQINHVIRVIRKIEAEGEDVDKFINGELDKTTNKDKPIDKKLNVQGDTAKLSNKELLNKMGKLENEIGKRRQLIESNKDLSPEQKENELFDTYKLWQQKYELQNILQDRKLSKNEKDYSRYNEHKELETVRESINATLTEMSKVFTDENYEGDKVKAFDEYLSIHTNLRSREDELIGRLESKKELSNIRSQADEQERKILEKFNPEKIKNNNMLINEKEDYTKEIEKLSSIYEKENMKVKEMQESGIDVKDINKEILEKLVNVKGSDAEKLLLARAEMKLDIKDEPVKFVNISDTKRNQESTSKNKNSVDNTVNGGSSTANERIGSGPQVVEKIIEKPSRLDQRLDINKLNQRDEEIISEINKLKTDNTPSKNQTIRFEGEQIESLGEEIGKNFDRNNLQQSSNVVQNITQNLVVKNAAELDGEFSKHFGQSNNQIFFENLIKKYGTENIKLEMNEMKNYDDIRNAKGLLITRLKNNHNES